MRTYGAEAMKHVARKADPVDEYVTELTMTRLTQPDAAGLWTAELPDASELMAEADTLRRRRDDIALDYADGAMTASSFEPPTARVLDRLGEMRRRSPQPERRRRWRSSPPRTSKPRGRVFGCAAAGDHRRADDAGAALTWARHPHISA